MKIIRGIEQNTPEWFDLRCGSLGGYGIRFVMAEGKLIPKTQGGDGKRKAKSKGYMDTLYKLAGEQLTGKPAKSISLPQFDRGHEYEHKGIEYAEFIRGYDAEQVTMILSDTPGRHHSPDSIIEDQRGGIEVKTRAPHIFLEFLETEKIPIADIRQCQNFLNITSWDWIDYVVYCVPEPKKGDKGWIKRIYPDPVMIR